MLFRRIVFLVALYAVILLCGVHLHAQSGYCINGRFSQNYVFDSSQIKITVGVPYAVSERWPSNSLDTLKFDVFEPDPVADSLTKRPFILLIHGGAFLTGNRRDMHYQCMEYARRGFVAATISYRLGWNCNATDLLGVCIFCQGENYKLQTATYRAAQDARAALRFITAHAVDYGVDTAWIFTGGESAGSITAMHAAFWNQQDADVFATWASSEVGLLDTAGNNLPSGYTIKAVIDNCGAVSRDTVMLNNENIPVISFHDENDCVVPTNTAPVISCTCQAFYWASGSSVIHNKMTNAGLCHEMNLVPVSINHCSYPTWNLVKRASCFLKRVMCSNCTGGFNNTTTTVVCDTLQQNETAIAVVKAGTDYPLSVFPNPSTGPLILDLSNLSHLFPVSIKVIDATGRLIAEENEVRQVQYPINLTLINAGVYFINVSSASGVVSKVKVMIQP